MRFSWILFLIGPCLLQDVLSSNILVVLPMPLYSHTMPFIPVVKALAERGHQITFIGPYYEKTSPLNFHNIKINVTIEKMQEVLMRKGISPQDFSGLAYQTLGVWKICSAMMELWNPEIKKVLPPSSEQIDLIILEPYFCQEPLMGIGHLYGAPVVAVMPGPLTPTMALHSGNPTIPSYVPHIRTQLTDQMSIWGRLKNTLITVFELIGHKLYFLRTQDKIMRELLGEPNLPYLGDMLSNISLTLIETHFSLNYPRPYARNIVEVGGISVKVAEPLPADLEKFISESEHGVILFSWGSHYEGRDKVDILINIMESFRYIKQRVLFKTSRTDFQNIPKNVLVSSWFPQPSVLEHKNVVLFISHGGLNSIHEAAYFGVPVIGTPAFSDQPHNVRLMEHLGVGIYLDPYSITDPSVMVSAMQRILNDSRYRERAQERAKIIRDRPLPVLDEAVYWVEYVLKYRGAPHLRPAALDLAWYQLFLLDVVAIVLAVIVVCSLVVYYSFRYFFYNSQSSRNIIKKKQN